MSIVKMKKFHLLALKSDKDELLRRLQIFRNVEFSKVETDSVGISDIEVKEELNRVETDINHCKYCLDIANKYYPKKSGFAAIKKGMLNLTFSELEIRAGNIEFEEIYDKFKLNGSAIDGVHYDMSKVKEEIEELNVYKKFDVIPTQLQNLKDVKSYIGSIPIKASKEFEEALSEIYTVHFEQIGIKKDEAVYVIIYHVCDIDLVDEIIKTKGFSKSNLKLDKTVKDRILELREDEKKLTQREKEIKSNIENLTSYREDVEIYYEYMSNLKVRLLANSKAKGSDATCVFEGYFPEEQEKEFVDIVNETTDGAYDLQLSVVDKDSEEVPIMLKNNKLFGVFEPITKTYAMPKYNEIDPTPFFAPFYALFFGMMSADAGYGLLVLIGCIFALKAFNLSVGMRKNIKFFTVLSVFTVIWGIVYNSYFGVKLDFMPQLLDMSSQVINILILAIVFGIIHLFAGLAIKAYLCIKEGKILDAVFGVFSWYVTLISAGITLLGSSIGISEGAVSLSKYIMYIGFVMIIIGGAIGVDGNIGAKLGAGLYNLYGITGYVGDIVSYSRLLALGLSGAYIALSVNTIAGLMFGNIIGMIFAVLVLLVFHAFNIFLSYLGAYVHGMRLIYVEFFGKFYEGGGREFKHFRSESKYINLDRQYEE